MKVTIVRWAVILIPLETAVVLIGVNMSKEASDLAMGIVLGLGVVLVAFIIGWFIRTGIQDHQQQEERRKRQPSTQPRIVDADWRDWNDKKPMVTAVVNRNGKKIEPPNTTRALVKRD